MRRFSLMAGALALVCFAPQARAAVIANLGDFESGSAPGWQQTSWVLSDNTYWTVSNSVTESPVTASKIYPPNGAWQIISDTEGFYGTAVLYKDFPVPANADSLKFRLWYRSSTVSDIATLDPGGQGQGLRVDVMDPSKPILTMAGVMSTPFATSYPGNAADDLTPRTIAVSVAAWRGTTVRLRLAAMSNTAPMVAGLDDVQLVGSQFLEVATALPVLSHAAADWGDFDGDGDLDLALIGLNGSTRTASIYRNDGGTFVKLLDLPLGLEGGDIRWLDLDRDGDVDIVASGVSASGSVFETGINQGGGVFTWTVTASDWGRAHMDLGDMDRDGDEDIVGGTSATGMFLRNTASGLQPGHPTGSAYDSTAVAWGPVVFPGFDVSGFNLNPSGGEASIMRIVGSNDGAGIIAGGTYSAFSDAISGGSLEYADADGDGYYERFLAGRTVASGISFFRADVSRIAGNPRGTITTDLPGLSSCAAAWADVDADGDRDLIVGGFSAGTATRITQLELWSGSSLTNSGLSFPAVNDPAFCWGDFDNDGDSDLLLMGQSATGPVTKLYRNTLATVNAAPAAPVTPWLTFDATHVYVYYPAPVDDHTPSASLTLDVRMGTTPGANDVMAACADPVTGARRTTREGALRTDRRYAIALATAVAMRAPFYTRFQAIDAMAKGSAWSPELTASIGGWSRGVTDVPGDQGGAVRVRFRASLMDTTGAPAPVTQYTIWQRVPGTVPAAPTSAPLKAAAHPLLAARAGEPAIDVVESAGHTFLQPASAMAAGFPPGTWEAVSTVSALQQPEYYARVSTTADSGATGANWSVFVVTSHTATPTTWWVSVADSGKSVDNIAPGVPQGLVAHYHTGSGNALAWQPSADADFQYFRIYRGGAPGFAIGASTLVANVAGTSWSDAAHDAPGVWYAVTAVDHNGNESAAAGPGQTTAVDAAAGLAFALAPPSPSPFAGATHIAFTLARPGEVALEVYDAGGRRVRTLAGGSMAAGAHEVSWDGRGDAGERIGAGLLFVRLRADGHTAVRRVVALGAGR